MPEHHHALTFPMTGGPLDGCTVYIADTPLPDPGQEDRRIGLEVRMLRNGAWATSRLAFDDRGVQMLRHLPA
jgi:hypothetical protein